ncbi:hypothetical protein HDU67_000643 [Dinochytrium kinnereticum]|nr:hypothetical protein HDU67_000643 [Dinochytrium kinnereticum]
MTKGNPEPFTVLLSDRFACVECSGPLSPGDVEVELTSDGVINAKRSETECFTIAFDAVTACASSTLKRQHSTPKTSSVASVNLSSDNIDNLIFTNTSKKGWIHLQPTTQPQHNLWSTITRYVLSVRQRSQEVDRELSLALTECRILAGGLASLIDTSSLEPPASTAPLTTATRLTHSDSDLTCCTPPTSTARSSLTALPSPTRSSASSLVRTGLPQSLLKRPSLSASQPILSVNQSPAKSSDVKSTRLARPAATPGTSLESRLRPPSASGVRSTTPTGAGSTAKPAISLTTRLSSGIPSPSTKLPAPSFRRTAKQ